MQNESSGREKEPACKPKKKSRLLRLGKWTGYVGSAGGTVFSLGDALGLLKADLMCVTLLFVMAGLGAYIYYLRLHTSQPVK